MGISDPSLNFSGILGWGHLDQSSVKSQFCSLFFQLAVVSLTVPSTGLSPLAVERSAADRGLKQSEVL